MSATHYPYFLPNLELYHLKTIISLGKKCLLSKKMYSIKNWVQAIAQFLNRPLDPTTRTILINAANWIDTSHHWPILLLLLNMVHPWLQGYFTVLWLTGAVVAIAWTTLNRNVPCPQGDFNKNKSHELFLMALSISALVNVH